ncbi:MAG: right-handed parallel beta-helix repeat-containing protein [Clostridia bacterium]|nr:right-handed parallel beta-helix repeat-containing protein [Clostridia bacterium]
MKRLCVLLLLICLSVTACTPDGGTAGSDPVASTTTSGGMTTTAVVTSHSEAPTTTTGQVGSTTTAGKTTVKTTVTTSAPVKPGGYDRTVTVDFAEYDLGNDDAYSLNLAIDTINTMGSVAATKGERVRYVLKMPKRRYEFNKTIQLKGVQDMTIDGGGSQFIMTDKVSAFYLTGCKNVTLTNFTVDYDPLRYTQGVIKAVNGNKLTVEIDAGYPSDVAFINGGSQTHDDAYNVGTSVFTANLHDAETGVVKENTPTYWIHTDAVSKGGRLVEVTSAGGTSSMQVGDRISFSYVGEKLLWAEQCLGGLVFTDITVWGTSGAGFWELDGEGGSVYRNVTVKPGPKPAGATRDRLVAVNGDFLHQNANRKGPLVENCTFTYLMDDAINIHGLVYHVLSSEGNTALIAPRWDFPFEVGETLVVYDGESLADKSGKVTVTAIQSYQDATLTEQIKQIYAQADQSWEDDTLVYKVTTDRPLGAAYGDYVVSPDRMCVGTVVRNSTFGKNRSRGIMVKSSDVLIENNTVISTGYPAITLHMDLCFGESGYSQNAVIRGNTIINGAVDEGLRWHTDINQLGAILIGYWLDGRHGGYQNNYEHKNILIENNVIQGTSVYGIACLNVDGLTIRGNTITDPFKYGVGAVGSRFGLRPDGGILIAQCKNVTVTGNTVTGGPEQITQAVQIDKNVSAIKANTDNKKK